VDFIYRGSKLYFKRSHINFYGEDIVVMIYIHFKNEILLKKNLRIFAVIDKVLIKSLFQKISLNLFKLQRTLSN
jgi:hypothetical protein